MDKIFQLEKDENSQANHFISYHENFLRPDKTLNRERGYHVRGGGVGAS